MSTPIITREKEGDDIMQQSKASISLTESQFYARTSNTPQTKRSDLNERKMDEILHDNVTDLNISRNQMIRDNGKKIVDKIFRIINYSSN